MPLGERKCEKKKKKKKEETSHVIVLELPAEERFTALLLVLTSKIYLRESGTENLKATDKFESNVHCKDPCS